MNNININNIFSNYSKETTTDNNILNINSLVNNNCFNVVNDDFVIKKIKNSKLKEKKKLNEFYETKYKECLLKINNSIDLNAEQLTFKIDKIYFGYKNYDYKECIEYMNSRLKNKGFKTQNNDNELIINWKNIN